MSRLLSMIVLGAILALILMILFFIGIHQNYFEALSIKLFFNAFFFAHFNWIVYTILAILFGFLFIYPQKQHAAVFLYSILMLASMSTFVPSIGMYVGKQLFEQAPFHIKHGRFLYQGVLQYESLYRYYLLDDDANRTIIFEKGAVIEAY